MSFASPYLLLLLAAVPLSAFGVRLLERRRVERSRAWAPRALQANMVTRPGPWRRYLPTALLLVGAAVLLVGFARPRASFHVSTQDATVVLVLDVSGSMAANDVKPSRLAAAKLAASRFLEQLPHGYRVSVVDFSDHSAVVAPPTHDLTRVKAVIARARSGPQGTALAAAVEQAARVAASVGGGGGAKRPPAVVVLFSDGGQTAGRVTPQQAIAAAKKAHAPVTTVLAGTPDGVVTQTLQGGYKERIQVPAQATILRTIAGGTGGRFYPSLQSVDVKRVYDALGSRVGTKQKTVEVTAAAAGGGVVLMLAGALLSGLWFRRFP